MKPKAEDFIRLAQRHIAQANSPNVADRALLVFLAKSCLAQALAMLK